MNYDRAAIEAMANENLLCPQCSLTTPSEIQLAQDWLELAAEVVDLEKIKQEARFILNKSYSNSISIARCMEDTYCELYGKAWINAAELVKLLGRIIAGEFNAENALREITQPVAPATPAATPSEPTVESSESVNIDSKLFRDGLKRVSELSKDNMELYIENAKLTKDRNEALMDSNSANILWTSLKGECDHLTTQLAERDAKIAELTPLADAMRLVDEKRPTLLPQEDGTWGMTPAGNRFIPKRGYYFRDSLMDVIQLLKSL